SSPAPGARRRRSLTSSLFGRKPTEELGQSEDDKIQVPRSRCQTPRYGCQAPRGAPRDSLHRGGGGQLLLEPVPVGGPAERAVRGNEVLTRHGEPVRRRVPAPCQPLVTRPAPRL